MLPVRAQLAKMVPKFTMARDEMDKLANEPDVATGHAFIAFHAELDRNKFYVLFNPEAR